MVQAQGYRANMNRLINLRNNDNNNYAYTAARPFGGNNSAPPPPPRPRRVGQLGGAGSISVTAQAGTPGDADGPRPQGRAK